MTTTLAGHGALDPGAPIVFLHGVFMDHRMWDGVRRELAVPSLALDMPGHGESPPLAGSTLDEHVAAVAAALDRARVSRCLIAGHSWGGMTALRLAIRRPDLVSGLLLCNTPLRRTTGLSRAAFTAQRVAVAAGLAPLPFFATRAAKALYDDEFLAARPALVDEMRGRVAAMGRNNVADAVRSVLLDPPDALALLDRLAVPWLFMAGRDDYVLTGGVGGHLQQNDRLVTVDGGHMSPVERPADVADALSRVQEWVVRD